MPAIGAVFAALAPIAEAALVAAGIGALVGGAACGIGDAVSGYQVHGELNRDVAINSAHAAAECAAEGAAVGAFTAPVGIVGTPIVAPVFAPVIQVVNDVARPIVQMIDDAAWPILGKVDDISRPMSLNLGAAEHSARMSTEKAVSTASRNVRSGLPPAAKRLLPKSSRSAGYVYVMQDTSNGARKIGLSVDPARRLGEVQRAVGNEVNLTCTISTYNMRTLESALHTAYAGTRLPNTAAGTEWFRLNATQVKAICG